MVWVGNKKIDQKDGDIKQMSDKLTELVENNTKTLGTMAQTVAEQNEIAKTLNQRIYDVLTKHTNN